MFTSLLSRSAVVNTLDCRVPVTVKFSLSPLSSRESASLSLSRASWMFPEAQVYGCSGETYEMMEMGENGREELHMYGVDGISFRRTHFRTNPLTDAHKRESLLTIKSCGKCETSAASVSHLWTGVWERAERGTASQKFLVYVLRVLDIYFSISVHPTHYLSLTLLALVFEDCTTPRAF